jgi:hypothetical protein
MGSADAGLGQVAMLAAIARRVTPTRVMLIPDNQRHRTRRA